MFLASIWNLLASYGGGGTSGGGGGTGGYGGGGGYSAGYWVVVALIAVAVIALIVGLVWWFRSRRAPGREAQPGTNRTDRAA